MATGLTSESKSTWGVWLAVVSPYLVCVINPPDSAASRWRSRGQNEVIGVKEDRAEGTAKLYTGSYSILSTCVCCAAENRW